MNKLLTAASLLILFFISSCEGNNSSNNNNVTPTSPTASTFNLTFKGTNYNLTPSTITTSEINSEEWQISVFGSNKSIGISLQALGNVTAGVGIYKLKYSSNGNNFVGGKVTIVNNDEGGTVYTSDPNDTISSVIVTISNSTECKGTFTSTVGNNGTFYPVTGSFDYHH